MSVSSRRSAALAAALLAALATQAQAQRILNPPAPMQPQVLPPNAGVLGTAAPASMAGYNPYAPALGGYNPATMGAPASDPYALSTVGGFNPYTSPSASMSSSPYSLSTSPTGAGFSGPYGMPYYPFYGGPGLAGPGMGYGFALQGLASYTSAAGKYWGDIEQARILREQSRQMYLDTQRRRIQFEQWYETVRPTAPKMMAAERATELELARKAPGETEVLSGRTLNVLLRSIQSAGNLNRGPNVELAEDALKHINVTGGASAGNVGMLKDGVKLAWPEGLQGEGFDTASKRLTRNLKLAVDTLKDREPVAAGTMKDIRGDFKSLNDKLNESADDLSPSQYIEARRFLNQLSAAIKALSDPNVAKYFNNTWNARGSNVAELVSNMTKEGLTFAPAAPGDEAAYRAMYNALRTFEVGLTAPR
jgi:hypothetical protein